MTDTLVAPHKAPIDYAPGWSLGVELGVGSGAGALPLYNVAHYNVDTYTSSADVDLWLDISCETVSIAIAEGAETLLDVQPPAQATVVLRPGEWQFTTEQPLRAGRPLRLRTFDRLGNARALFFGYVDAIVENYVAMESPTLTLQCVDAFGWWGRFAESPTPAPIGQNQTTSQRFASMVARHGAPVGTPVIEGSQVRLVGTSYDKRYIDLATECAIAEMGAVTSDHAGNLRFHAYEWRVWDRAVPVKWKIGNAHTAGEVCPSQWEWSQALEDLSTRVVVSASDAPFTPAQLAYLAAHGVSTSSKPGATVTLRDEGLESKYGAEPYERSSIMVADVEQLRTLAARYLTLRRREGRRVQSVVVELAAAGVVTNPNAIDMVTSIDCGAVGNMVVHVHHSDPDGLVFDADMLVIGVRHDITRDGWSAAIELDFASLYAATSLARYNVAHYNVDSYVSQAAVQRGDVPDPANTVEYVRPFDAGGVFGFAPVLIGSEAMPDPVGVGQAIVDQQTSLVTAVSVEGATGVPEWVITAGEPGGAVVDEVWIGPSEPTDPGVELWYDTDGVPPVLWARGSDGFWSAVTHGTSDVLWVGTAAPTDPTVELWYDTDEVSGAPLGVIAHKLYGTPSLTASVATRLVTFAAVPLVAGRMYDLIFGARAVRSNTTTASTLRLGCGGAQIAGPGTLTLAASGSGTLMDWWVQVTSTTAGYTSVFAASAPFTPSVTGAYDIGIDATVGAQAITVWGDTSPCEVRDLGPTQAAWP